MPNVTLRDVANLTVDGLAGGARAALAVHGDALGVVPDGLQVVHDSTTPAGRVLRYRETRHGIPVHGTEVVAVADASGRIQRLDLNLHPEAAVTDGSGTATITPDDAIAHATAAVDGTPRRTVTPAELVWLPLGGVLRLAYRVVVPTGATLYTALAEKPHDWETMVDAYSGEILSVADLLFCAPDGAGLVFDPNPVVSAGDNALRDPAGTPPGCGFTGTPQATVDAHRVTRTLRDLTFSGGIYKLEGPYCRIVDFGAPETANPEEATATAFRYASDDARFEAVNVYFHVDSFQRYLQSLGITTAHNGPIDCDPHEGSGGAWFSPVDGGLHFGASGDCRPDRAEDGDVLVHEYAHAIQRDMVPTWGHPNPATGRWETRAMGEGFGDVLAALYFSEAHGGYQREVFEDWIFAPGGLRRVDGTKTYPDDWAGEEHDDGEIWSAALWNAYRGMGGDSGDPAVRVAARDALVKSLVLANPLIPGNGTMPQGAEAVLLTNAALPDYRGVHCVAMLDAFHARGLLPVDPGADLHVGEVASWNSSDLWVRHTDDGGTAHQRPEFGQDNWFYARVTNRGTAPARAFVVTFNVTTFAGTEFHYPDDYLPPVSAAVGFDLAPGASTVVKALWPASMVPAPGTHACWLASVHTPATTPGLAQKALAVVDLEPGDAAVVPLQLGSLASVVASAYRLEVVRPAGFEEVAIEVVHRDPGVVDGLFRSIEAVPSFPLRERTAEVVGAARKRSITFLPGLDAGFPLAIQPRSPVKVGLRVEAPKTATAGESFTVDVVQRNASGEVVGGMAVQVNVC